MNSKDHYWQMPAAYLRVFLHHAADRQLPLGPLLQGTELQAGRLRDSEHPVSFGDTRQVLRNVTRMLGPGWHLALGPRLTLPSHGPLGFAVATAADFRAAVDVLLRFIGIRGPFLTLTGTVDEQRFVIRFFETTGMGEERQAMIELALLSVQTLLERPLGRELHGASLALAYPPPPYRERLESAFHARLAFDAKGHSLSFPVAWLEEPCLMNDPAMHRYLLNRCDEEIRELQGAQPAELTVRQALMSKPGQLPRLSEIAATQNVSARTLIRRLKRENTGYQAILEEVRRKLAVDYLRYSDMSIAQIAYRLGYQDPSNFGRAFRGWFSQSPGRYRDAATQGPLTR
jgi:AraC-like DNA-binding protein